MVNGRKVHPATIPMGNEVGTVGKLFRRDGGDCPKSLFAIVKQATSESRRKSSESISERLV